MIHGIISFLVAVVLAILNASFPAYFCMPAFYLGREVAQAEYRYIETHGGSRNDCPVMCGFLPSAWTAKGLMDWILPLMASMAVWLSKEAFF